MERRTALAYAAAAAGTVLAGSTALAATTGVLGGNDPDPVEIEDISASDDDLETTTTLGEPEVTTVVVDEYITAPAPAGTPVVDDQGGLRSAGTSDDSPDAFDDNGGDRPDGVSDDVYEDDDYEDEDEDDDYEDDDHDEDESDDEDDDHDEDESDDD